jgi:hypothetical protein
MLSDYFSTSKLSGMSYCLSQPYRNALDPHFAQFFNEIGNGIGPEISLSMLAHVENIEAK